VQVLSILMGLWVQPLYTSNHSCAARNVLSGCLVSVLQLQALVPGRTWV
jgi:hypothetical protein